MNALHYAVRNSRYRTARLFLEQGLHTSDFTILNEGDSQGRTPLHHAVE